MNKKRIIALVAIVAVIALMLGVYLATRPETQQGSKAITVQVVHKDGTEKTFTYRTDAEFLAEVLLAEKLIPAIGKLPNALKHLYVMVLILLSFVLFNGEDLAQVGADFAGMFGFGKLPIVTAETLYYLGSYGLLFVVGFLGATPLPKQVAMGLEKTRIGWVLEVLMMAALLLVCTAYLVDGSFSPFLYFRF